MFRINNVDRLFRGSMTLRLICCFQERCQRQLAQIELQERLMATSKNAARITDLVARMNDDPTEMIPYIAITNPSAIASTGGKYSNV